MCVIIYVPKTSSIKISEIEDAWRVNPDGAGFSIQVNGKVYFKRGFMKLDDYIDAITPLIGKYNLLLHFRISTSNEVNRVQTHPYKKGNVTLTEGFTSNPVICMNGIISGQKEYKDCNDTMSYIVDHAETFKIVNQDILNIIEKATGAKWAVMKPDEVILSSKFQEEEGRYYSNKNHKWSYRFYSFKENNSKNFNNLIKSHKLKKAIRNDRELHTDVLDFIDIWCNNYNDLCGCCTKCLKSAKTLRDVKMILNENYYFEPIEETATEEERAWESFFEDFYDYDYDNCCYFIKDNK